MTQKRIAVGGKAGAGKDFMLGLLTQYEAGMGDSIRITGFGDLVRAYWVDHYDDSPTRSDLQKLGQIMRENDPLFWVKRAQAWASDQPWDAVLGISGVRFENEIQGLQAVEFKVGLVRAELETRRHRLFHRDGYWWPDGELNHPTELALDEVPEHAWDFILYNN